MTTQTEQVLAECLALLLEERKTSRGEKQDTADLKRKLGDAHAEIGRLKAEIAATKHNLGPSKPLAVPSTHAPDEPEVRSPVQDF